MFVFMFKTLFCCCRRFIYREDNNKMEKDPATVISECVCVCCLNFFLENCLYEERATRPLTGFTCDRAASSVNRFRK